MYSILLEYDTIINKRVITYQPYILLQIKIKQNTIVYSCCIFISNGTSFSYKTRLMDYYYSADCHTSTIGYPICNW